MASNDIRAAVGRATAYDAFETLDATSPKSLTWASDGGDGSGKSHFGLTAPGPIFVAAFDPYGMNRVSKDVKAGKDIRIKRYAFNPQDASLKTSSGQIDRQKVLNAAQALWQQFRQDYDIALDYSKTVLIDREDLMYELQRYANFGAQNDAPKEYGPLYIEYGWIIQKATARAVNLGLLRGQRDKWESKMDPSKGKLVGHNTGKRVPDGNSKVPDHVDVTLTHRWSAEDKAYMVKIGKFPNIDEKDQEYPNLTFVDMATLAYPDTSAEDWQ